MAVKLEYAEVKHVKELEKKTFLVPNYIIIF
jgi:hypothetical protein